MHGFAPLSANPAFQRDDAGRRLRLIADAYDLTERQRLDIIPLLGRRTQVMHIFLAQQAAQGTQPWARLWQQGHGDAWQADNQLHHPARRPLAPGTARIRDGAHEQTRSQPPFTASDHASGQATALGTAI